MTFLGTLVPPPVVFQGMGFPPDPATMLPDPALGSLFFVAGVLLSEGLGRPAGRWRDGGVPVGYTRKAVHFGVFTVAGFVYLAGALPLTNAFGAGVALRVLVCVARGEKDPLYRAFARPADAPRQGLFIVVPLVTTALGGLLTALLAGPYAAVGYLVGGWGDAAGEPVGTRWGRHPYRVPSLAGVRAQRTLEGSLGVFAAGTLGAALVLALLAAGWTPWAAERALGPGPGLVALGLGAVAAGGAGALAEAVSPHGTDNLTVPLLAAMAARWVLGA